MDGFFQQSPVCNAFQGISSCGISQKIRHDLFHYLRRSARVIHVQCPYWRSRTIRASGRPNAFPRCNSGLRGPMAILRSGVGQTRPAEGSSPHRRTSVRSRDLEAWLASEGSGSILTRRLSPWRSTVFLHQSAKCAAFLTGFLRGPRDVPAVPEKQVVHILALKPLNHFFARFAETGRRRTASGRSWSNIASADLCSTGEYDRSLDHVLKLADVAGPLIRHQLVQGSWRQDLALAYRRVDRNEVLRQQRNILR